MKIFMIGICGTAMANLATMLKQIGHSVSGSDENVYPPMSEFLVRNAIPVMEGYTEKIPMDTELVIVGNAISRGNPQAEQALREKMKMASMPQAIGEAFLKKTRNIVVTGTHGKTTTTAMIAAIMREAGFDPGFLIGGIAGDLGTGSHIGVDPWFILEGDEYDSAFFDKRSKFVHYAPDILLINNIEFDHADIFRDLTDIKKSFKQVINIVPDNGIIVANGDNDEVREVCAKAPAPVAYFGLDNANEHVFEIRKNQRPLELTFSGMQIVLNEVWGEHNAYNAVAAAAVALKIGIDKKSIVNGLRHFRGVMRRMQYIGTWSNGSEFYQDFAHHPTAVNKTLNAYKNAFPERRLVVVFEPRSNTMVRHFFQKELTDALAVADYIFIGKLHRLEKISPQERLNRPDILKTLMKKGKVVSENELSDDIFKELLANTGKNDLVVIMSNGSFDGLIEKVQSECIDS